MHVLSLVAFAGALFALPPPGLARTAAANVEPAPPVAAAQLPPSRTRTLLDADEGPADPRAVAAFRTARLGAGLMHRLLGVDSVVHAGQGFYETGSPSGSFGAYANHTLYVQQREPGNPNSEGFLYAPTMFGPGADCIEAVTVVQDKAPQVWAWDWCAAKPNPYKVVIANPRFARSYVRTMSDGNPEFTVETILASDGVTWDMALYNYTRKRWDVIYQTSGARNPSYGLGQQGWDFFETYTDVESGISDICRPLMGPIAAYRMSIAGHEGGKGFMLLNPSNSTPLQFNSFYCPQLSFTVLQSNWDWQMAYQ